MEWVKKLENKLSLEYIKQELLRTAFSTEKSFFTQLDSRILLAWYSYFAIVPWFIYEHVTLVGYLLFMILLTVIARVSPLILTVLAIGLAGEILLLGFISLLFGGDLSIVSPMFWLSIKLAVISLASVTVFSSINPEKFSDALLRFGVPAQFSFSVAYAYRILPTLLEEFQQIILSYRLRGLAPSKNGVLYFRKIYYYIMILIKSFYPLILNSAKRSRTTVEALEIKGFSYAAKDKRVLKMKTSYLQTSQMDWLFLLLTVCYVVIVHGLQLIF